MIKFLYSVYNKYDINTYTQNPGGKIYSCSFINNNFQYTFEDQMYLIMKLVKFLLLEYFDVLNCSFLESKENSNKKNNKLYFNFQYFYVDIKKHYLQFIIVCQFNKI